MYVAGEGSEGAGSVRVGSELLDSALRRRIIIRAIDHGWVVAQSVFKLTVANDHTFFVGTQDGWSLVHNDSVCQLVRPDMPRKPGVCIVLFSNGDCYVGRSYNAPKPCQLALPLERQICWPEG